MKKLFVALSLALVLTAVIPVAICKANSAPPPSIIIGVSDAPAYLTMNIGRINAERKDRPFMTYFILDTWNLNLDLSDGLHVVSQDKTFDVPINTGKTFNNYFTLDLENQTLTSVRSLPGVKSIPFLMIILTLLIEGIVFYIFGYRQKRSWLIFLGVNLVTQLALITWLGGSSSLANMYAIFGLIIGEIGVLIIEMIAFGLLLRERGPLRRMSYVFLANILSLFIGGYIISIFAI